MDRGGSGDLGVRSRGEEELRVQESSDRQYIVGEWVLNGRRMGLSSLEFINFQWPAG